jgi:EamA domain-containing membrane protein RarD
LLQVVVVITNSSGDIKTMTMVLLLLLLLAPLATAVPLLLYIGLSGPIILVGKG